MKAFVFNYRCAKCNNITEAPGLPDMAYGEFIMFNDTGDSVYLNSFDDPVFDELESIFQVVGKKNSKINEENSAAIFRAVFAIVCDLSPNGSLFKIDQFPTCSKCGSKKMASWGPANPQKLTDNLKVPTHEKWNSLTENEKKVKVKEEIEKILENKGDLGIL